MSIDEQALKARLGEGLSISDEDLLDWVWQTLQRDASTDINIALNEPEVGLRDLIGICKDRGYPELATITRGRSKPPGRSAQNEPVKVELSPREREWATFLAEHLSAMANALPEVRRCREQHFGGKTLSEAEALEWLRHEVCDLRGISTDSETMGEQERELASEVWSASRAELLANLAEALATSVGNPPEHILPDTQHVEVPWDTGGWAGGWWRNSGGRAGWRQDGRRPTLRSETDHPGPGLVSDWLAGIYPWRPTEALWFVLTGELPKVVGAELSYDRQRNLFTLVFSPWVSENTLAKAHRGSKEHLRLGDNRPMEQKTLEVLRFVTQQTEEHGERPSWETLRRHWNTAQGREERKFKSRHGFRQACVRAEEFLGIREKREQDKARPINVEDFFG